MQILANGTKMYDDIHEVFYDLFMEIGLAVDQNQYIYDQDTMQHIIFKDKYLKVSMCGEPVYPGRNDIAFEPQGNYSLMSTLFGYYLDKAQKSEDGDIIGGYIAHYIDDNEDKTKQRVVVRSATRGDISSNYYYNIHLAFIDCIFRIAGYSVDLSNIDPIPVDDEDDFRRKKRRR